jgi:hypothetical protein
MPAPCAVAPVIVPANARSVTMRAPLPAHCAWTLRKYKPTVLKLLEANIASTRVSRAKEE